MTYNFCTLFDKNFLARGLCLHNSLLEQCSDFTLWMLCMDNESCAMLEKLKLEKVKILKVSDVEDERMREVKPTRTPVEYCWMFSSQLPLYLLEKTGVDMIAYLDADMYFYAPLETIYEQFGDNSIMIIPHGFSEKNKHREKTSGIYNVGMIVFKNDANALECLIWWKDRCIEWCFATYEDGKLGDQLYLNDWPTRFKKVFVLTDPGADVASWNIDRFTFHIEKDKIIGTEKNSGKKFPLIFYHFHGLKIYADSNNDIYLYPITVYERNIYARYLKALRKAYADVRMIHPGWSYGCVKKPRPFQLIKQRVALILRTV